MKPLIKISAIAVSTALVLTPLSAFAKEREEENIESSQVPAAVQKAAEKEAKGGKIVRWEKEGKTYEAVIEKNSKEWGYVFDANGAFKNKHDDSKEKGEKH